MTPEKIMAYVAVITLVGGIVVTVAGWLLHAKDAAQEKEMTRVAASLDAAWKKIDELKDDRHNYLTHEYGEKLRSEFKLDITELGTRLITEIEKVSTRFREDMKMIIKERQQ